MNIYVAGSIREVSRVIQVQERVLLHHNITFDWTEYAIGVNGSVKELSELCRRGVNFADKLVYVQPQENKIGSLIEVGMALGAHKPVIIVDNRRFSAFWALPEVMIVRDEGEFQAALASAIC